MADVYWYADLKINKIKWPFDLNVLTFVAFWKNTIEDELSMSLTSMAVYVRMHVRKNHDCP